MNAAQQKAEHCINLPRRSSNSDSSGSISSLPRQLVGQRCSVRTDRGRGGARLMASARSHNHEVQVINSGDIQCTVPVEVAMPFAKSL